MRDINNKEVSDLKNISIFAGLTGEQLSRYSGCFITRSFTRNERILFNQLEEDAIFLIKKGRVKVSYFSEDGGEFIVTILKPGDIFSRHSEAVLTPLEKTDIWLVLTSDFKKILAAHPVVAMNLIRELGRIMRLMNNVVQDLAFREVSGRIAHLLLRETENSNADNPMIDLGLTHEEIANMVGSSRQTVTGILNRMAQRNIIQLRRGAITIIDREALKKYLG